MVASTEEQDRLLTSLEERRRADWDQLVSHQAPRTHAVVQAHEDAREIIRQAGCDLMELMPPCPQVDVVLQTLHRALLYANIGIVLHHPQNQDPTP